MLRAFFVIFAGCMLAAPGLFAGMFSSGISENESPSVIGYGWTGLKTGLLMGAAIGGLQAIREHEKLDNSGEGRRVLNGALYGTLGGTALGLGLGFYDLAQGRTGIAGIILRDISAGGGLGLVVGAAIGGITYSKTKDWGDVGQSAAWGYIGGSAAGLLFGFIEGRDLASNPNDPYKKTFRFAFAPDSRGEPCPCMVFASRF